MPKILKHRRGTSEELDKIIGSEGEIFINTENNTIRVMNGKDKGGFELLNAETLTQLSYNQETYILTYVDEYKQINSINLANLLNGNKDISNIFIQDNTLVFQKEDGSEILLDISEFFDDTNIITSVNGKTGDVILSKNDISDFNELDYQPFNEHTVIDENYVHTDNNFTEFEQNLLYTALQEETVTSLSLLDTNLTYTDESGNDTIISLDSIVTKSMSYVNVLSNYSASANEYIFADSSTTDFSISLPTSPNIGDTLYILDSKGVFDTTPILVSSSDNTIMGIFESITLDKPFEEYKFIFTGNDWRVV